MPLDSPGAVLRLEVRPAPGARLASPDQVDARLREARRLLEGRIPAPSWTPEAGDGVNGRIRLGEKPVVLSRAFHVNDADIVFRYAQRLLEFDPLEERFYQRLMRLHALNGDRAGALRVYHDCTIVLGRELGVEPSSETQAAYERLLNRDVSLPPQAEAGPLDDALPLIGRQREWKILGSVWRNVSRGGAHFVSISGDAGIGKTRMAEELLVWAEHQGITTGAMRCYAAGGQLAYVPLTELLRAEPLRSRLSKLSDIWLRELARGANYRAQVNTMEELLTMF